MKIVVYPILFSAIMLNLCPLLAQGRLFEAMGGGAQMRGLAGGAEKNVENKKGEWVALGKHRVVYNFKSPMIEVEKLGTEASKDLITVSPTVRYRSKWLLNDRLEIFLYETPWGDKKTKITINSTKDLAGNVVAATSTEVGNEKPELSKVYSSPGEGGMRPNVIVYSSNGWPIVKKGLGKAYFIQEKTGKQIKGKIIPFTVADWQQWGRDRYWIKAAFGELTPEEKTNPKTVINSVVLIQPETPLPTGNRWELVIYSPAGTKKEDRLYAGSIETVREFQMNLRYDPGERGGYLENGVRVREMGIDFNLDLANEIDPETFFRENVEIFVDGKGMSEELQKERVKVIKRGEEGVGFRVSPDFVKNWEKRKDKKLNYLPIQVFGNGVFDCKVVVNGAIAIDGQKAKSGKFEVNVGIKESTPELTMDAGNNGVMNVGNKIVQLSLFNIDSLTVQTRKVFPAYSTKALRAYEKYYENTGSERSGASERLRMKFLPLDMIPSDGEMVTKEMKVEGKEKLTLPLDELLGRKTVPGMYLIEARGRVNKDVLEGYQKYGMEFDSGVKNFSGDSAYFAVQALIQVTDLGLMWKQSGRNLFVYTYSLATGENIATGEVVVHDGEQTLAEGVLNKGMCNLELPQGAKYIRVTSKGDSYTVELDKWNSGIDMWNYNVPMASYIQRNYDITERKVFFFTDRGLYRPGEEVNLKGVVRELKDGELMTPELKSAELKIKDPRDGEVLSRSVTLSENGTFSLSFTLPAEQTGRYSALLSFPEKQLPVIALSRQAQAANREDNDDYNYYLEEFEEDNNYFYHSIAVQDFKRNEFEVKSSAPEVILPGDKEIAVSVEAKNYTGVPLSGASVDWVLESYQDNFYPAKYREYSFGDYSRSDMGYWAAYYGEVIGRSYTNDVKEKGKLDGEGKGTQALVIPKRDFPSLQQLRVTTAVTNSNEQIISSSIKRTQHPADVYVGIRRNRYVTAAGNMIPLGLIAVDKDGNPCSQDVKVRIKVLRKVFDSVRYGNINATTVKNTPIEECVYDGEAVIRPEDNAAAEKGGKQVEFKTQGEGVYYILVSGADDKGNEFATIDRTWVYGGSSSPWEYNDGIKMEMVPDKKLYYPGDTAKVLLQTPIEGEVLITVEREKVLRHYLTKVTLKNSVVEVPIEDGDAPNIYVSVFLTKGALESERKVKEPQIRLGYCQLKVSPGKYKLNVSLETPQESVLPGTKMEVKGKVENSDGEAVSGIELALFAVDEGTLDVSGYKTPDPLSYFYSTRPLYVVTRKMLQNLLSEDTNMRSFDNKGVFIGGGSDGDSPLEDVFANTRKNFKPCAYWIADVTSDAEGKFSAAYTNPDTLTRYRVMAVAVDKDKCFGAGEARYVVNKPVMVEPSPPFYAALGDELNIPVTLSKTTDRTGKWELEVKGNETVEIAEPKQSLELPSTGVISRTVKVKFVNTGEAKLTWILRPIDESGALMTGNSATSLSDVIENNFSVILPAPILRERHYFTVKQGEEVNLFKMLSPELQSVKSDMSLKMGTSPVLYAEGSVNFLLGYPYGCLEQTSSQTIPWLYADIYSRFFPNFPKYTPEKRKQIIQAAADKLVRHQMGEGALAYWEGSTSTDSYSLQFTPYGALTLLMCKEAGAEVSQGVIQGLGQYLNSLTEENSGAVTEYFSAWVLAKAKNLSEAKLNKLLDKEIKFDERKDISPGQDRLCRLYLGLALMELNSEEHASKAKELLMKVSPKSKESARYAYNLGWFDGNSQELEIILRSRISPNDEDTQTAVANFLNKNISRSGYMNTTWTGGWESLALGEYLKQVGISHAGIDMELLSSAGSKTETLSGDGRYSQFSLPNDDGSIVRSKSEDALLYAALSIAGRPVQWKDYKGVDKGYRINRKYEKMDGEGKWVATRQFEVGDIIRISLYVVMGDMENRNYVALEDNLPSALEPINPALTSQAGYMKAITNGYNMPNWVNHCEYLKDRVRFFVNYWEKGQFFEGSYLARVTKSGEVTAPPAKAESMYSPQQYGLGANERLIIAPRREE